MTFYRVNGPRNIQVDGFSNWKMGTLDRSRRSPGTDGCVYGRPRAMTVKRRENFQFKIRTTRQRTVKNMSFDKVRNSLVISLAESSITEEEFPF